MGLLLGARAKLRDGSVNPFFQKRIDAAAELYLSGKIKRLLISGDSHKNGVDEPMDMKAALLAQGVPETAMILDGLSLRTLDSVVRARKVFGLDHFTIISQDFHNRRALLIAKHYHIDTIACSARDVPISSSIVTTIRESLSRVKVVLDLYLLRTTPSHLEK
jgi:SanA protein